MRSEGGRDYDDYGDEIKDVGCSCCGTWFWWKDSPSYTLCAECWHKYPESRSIADSPRLIETLKTAVQEWVDKQGHDRCWYYPELFERLATLLNVNPIQPANLPPRAEFEEGCRKYQDQEFGKCSS